MSTDLIPTPETWARMKSMASDLVRSGILPKAVNTPEKALAIMLKGKELGIPPMEALTKLYVVNGAVATAAEEMLVLIYTKIPGAKIVFKNSSRTRCEIEASRPGVEPTLFTYTIEDARGAGLLHKDNWKGYPKQMLKWRTITDMARTIFPDALSGVSHTPEELGARVTLNEAGQVQEIDADIIEPEGIPEEIYDGTIGQNQDLREIFLLEGIESRELMREIAEKAQGKTMEAARRYVRKEAKRHIAELEAEQSPSQRNLLADDYRQKLKVLEDQGFSEAECMAFAGVKKWADLDNWSEADLQMKLKTLSTIENGNAARA